MTLQARKAAILQCAQARKAAILQCAETNSRYMRRSAGQAGYPAVVGLYDRLADQSLDCARAWAAAEPIPDHEPAVDAFWWGLVEWAHYFTVAILRWGSYQEIELYREMDRVFVRPHVEFASWLRPDLHHRHRVPNKGVIGAGESLRAAEVILRCDVRWTWCVILRTARWGLLHHLKRDAKALWQALFLMRRLRQWPDPVAVAYLESDVVFLRELFGHFEFSHRMKAIIENFLAMAAQSHSGQRGTHG